MPNVTEQVQAEQGQSAQAPGFLALPHSQSQGSYFYHASQDREETTMPAKSSHFLMDDSIF